MQSFKNISYTVPRILKRFILQHLTLLSCEETRGTLSNFFMYFTLILLFFQTLNHTCVFLKIKKILCKPLVSPTLNMEYAYFISVVILSLEKEYLFLCLTPEQNILTDVSMLIKTTEDKK